MLRRLFSLLLAFLVLSGCQSKDTGSPQPPGPPGHEQQPPEDNGTIGNGNETPPGQNNQTYPQTMRLEGCAYWFANLAIPSSLLPGEPPEGWEPNDPTLAGQGRLSTQGFKCDKISLGPFERGPIWIVMDGHANADFPEDCVANTRGFTKYHVMNVFLTNDLELQIFLNETYGMPTMHANIVDSSTPQGTIQTQDWTWTPDGAQSSTISIVDDGTYGDESPNYERFFWEHGAGIGKLEIQVDPSENPFPTDRVSTGHFEAPMLAAEFNDGDFRGDGSWNPSVTGVGEFTLFKDRFCEEPE